MHPIVKKLLIRCMLWMIVIMLAGVAALVAVVPAHAKSTGSWNHPGENPFKGSRWHAVMSYKEIPLIHRVILGLRVQWDRPDHLLKITKRGVFAEGQVFTSDITGMHFGSRGRFDSVDMSGWSEDHVEWAPAWCYESSCIGSPYVCNNIFLITREFNAETIKRESQSRGDAFLEEASLANEPLSLLITITTIAGCFCFSRSVRPLVPKRRNMKCQQATCRPLAP